MLEIWKDIYFIENGVEYDYRGLYQVSNHGRVKSLNYRRTGKEKILKDRYKNNGYLFVCLCKNTKNVQLYNHRLVAHMFLSNYYFDGACVDHIDTNKQNNNVENLRWVSYKENSNNPLTLKHLNDGLNKYLFELCTKE